MSALYLEMFLGNPLRKLKKKLNSLVVLEIVSVNRSCNFGTEWSCIMSDEKEPLNWHCLEASWWADKQIVDIYVFLVLPPPSKFNNSTLKDFSSSGMELSVMLTKIYLYLSPDWNSTVPAILWNTNEIYPTYYNYSLYKISKGKKKI